MISGIKYYKVIEILMGIIIVMMTIKKLKIMEIRITKLKI